MKEETIAECQLPLSGAFNFRDMGGLKTLDGRRVKKGILFRAAELTGLTKEDLTFLGAFQIKRVFDYRRKEEADRKPDPIIGLAINERLSVMKEENITTSIFKEGGFNKEYYLQFTVDHFVKIYSSMPIQNASYQRLMSLLKNPEKNLPLVHHCTGGRDRTGFGSLLIYMTLGVPYETVLDDYLLSNYTLIDHHNRILEKAAQFFTEQEFAEFKNAFPLRKDYLQAAMNSILKNYGDFDTYISEEFGITDEIRSKIKNYCLE